MRAGRALTLGAACLVLGAAGEVPTHSSRQAVPATPYALNPSSLAKLVPASAASALVTLDERFDQGAAMELVRFMDRYWRNAANEGFDATIAEVRHRLLTGGFSERTTRPVEGPSVWVEEFGRANGWDYTVGTLTLLADAASPEEVLLSRERHRVALCINSFSTPPGGVVAPIVDVGQGTAPADYDGRDVHGAVVLGDAGPGRLWQMAVVQRGAIGVVSTALEDYIRPGPPGSPADRAPRDEWDVLQWGSVPLDDARRAFGFKATPRAAARIRARLAARSARVKAEIVSSLSPGPVRSIIAEIPGAVRPQERILLVAHIQEPGANDNASGCATLAGLARGIMQGVRDKKLPAPGRTLTFLWGDEIRASRQWISDHPAEAKQVRYMFSLDMTGENTRLTGGPFLIEKAPDPTAVWPRPSDPHTEWGSPPMKAESLQGTLLNDVFLAVCARLSVNLRLAWEVRTNPYEGGSDHAVFLAAGVPSVLAWHFPDRFYHSSLDRPTMTDPVEMKRVGISVGATALLLASASQSEAAGVANLVVAAAGGRMRLERSQGKALVERAADQVAAEAEEVAVVAAWKTWYAEALREVVDLPPAGPSQKLRTAVEQALRRVASL